MFHVEQHDRLVRGEHRGVAAADGQFARGMCRVCRGCARVWCGCAVCPAVPVGFRYAAAPLPPRSRSARAHGRARPYQGGGRGGGMPHRERQGNL